MRGSCELAGGTDRRALAGLAVALRVDLSGTGVDLTGRVVMDSVFALREGPMAGEFGIRSDDRAPLCGGFLFVGLNFWNMAPTDSPDRGVDRWLSPLRLTV